MGELSFYEPRTQDDEFRILLDVDLFGFVGFGYHNSIVTDRLLRALTLNRTIGRSSFQIADSNDPQNMEVRWVRKNQCSLGRNYSIIKD